MWAIIALLGLAVFGHEAGALPNIVHFMADDPGWNDLGHFNGGKTITTNIDTLITDGIRLDRFHTFKVCAPSRTSTMTGRYPFNVGYYDMDHGADEENRCFADYTMLPALLKTRGYSTHAFGKWDVGYAADVCTPTYAPRKGRL